MKSTSAANPVKTRNRKNHETSGKAAVTRSRLLDAAAKVMGEVGYTGMRLADVGEAAGVQAPAIYYHFNSKEDLACEVFKSGLVRSAETMERSLLACSEMNALQRVAVAIEVHLRMTARRSDYARATAYRFGGHVPSSIQEYCRPYERNYARIWVRLLSEASEEGLLREGVDPKTAHLMLLGALNSVSYTWKPERSAEVDRVIVSCQQILLNGLARESLDLTDLSFGLDET